MVAKFPQRAGLFLRNPSPRSPPPSQPPRKSGGGGTFSIDNLLNKSQQEGQASPSPPRPSNAPPPPAPLLPEQLSRLLPPGHLFGGPGSQPLPPPPFHLPHTLYDHRRDSEESPPAPLGLFGAGVSPHSSSPSSSSPLRCTTSGGVPEMEQRQPGASVQGAEVMGNDSGERLSNEAFE